MRFTDRDGRKSTRFAGVPVVTPVLITLLWLGMSGAPVHGQQTGAVTGQVTNAQTGDPLEGVQLVVVGEQVGSITDAEGRYRITEIPVGQHQIRAQLIGYSTSTRTVEVQAGQATQLNLRLSRSAVDMQEIVVTGQAGAAQRREIGTSISSISTEELEARPVNDLQEVLQGSSQGLAVLPNDGMSGAGSTIRLRGANSITQGNQPLIYVDGIRIDNGYYGNYKANLNPTGSPNTSSRPLQDINPQNIERVEVIKGAAATTLYGTEASAGVIQIFTKSGEGLRRNTTRWTVNLTGGLSTLRTLWPRAEFDRDLWFQEYGQESKGLWMDMWKETGSSVDANMSVMRQSEDVNVFAAGRFQKENNVLPEQGFNAYNVQGNLRFSPAPNLVLQVNNLVNQRNIDWISNSNEAEGFMLNVMRGPRGYTPTEPAADSLVLQQDYDDNQTHWVSSVNLNYQPVTQFNAQLTLGYDFIDAEQQEVLPFGAFFAPQGNRFVQRVRKENRSLDLRTHYREDITPNISSTTSTGFQVYQSWEKFVTARADNFAGPHRPTLTSGADREVVETRLEEITAGWFAQERVGFSDRLFLTAGVRIDGNSTFGEEKDTQTYPSGSFSYIISEEDFWPDFFDQTKIRGAVGQSGQAPGFFDAERVWAPVIRGEDQTAVTPDNRGNPELGPERTTEWEAGIETSMLDGRLSLNGSVYRQVTRDALVPVPQDPTRGFLSAQLRNIGKVSNEGFEVTVTGSPVDSRDLTWTASATTSLNSSEVEDLGGAGPIEFGDLTEAREGFPLAAYFVDQVENPNEMAEPQFTDETFLGPSIPEWTGSLSSTVSIGERLTVRAMGEYQAGHYVQDEISQLNTVRRVWPPCLDEQIAMEEGRRGELTAFQRAQCDINIAEDGPHHYEADFFRVREASVRYRLPQGVVPGGFESLSVRLSGRNLALFTGYEGIDPEMSELFAGGGGNRPGHNREAYYTLPPHRKFFLSLNATF